MRLPRTCLLALAVVHGGHAAGEPWLPGSEAIDVVATPITDLEGTKTSIWSTTQTSSTFVQFINDRRITFITTMTVTSLEPPVTVTSFPATVTETVFSHVTWDERGTYIGNGDTYTSVTSFIATVHDTWIVHQPKQTDLPAGSTSTGGLPCGKEAAPGGCSGGPPDPLCEADGLRTGCEAQCTARKRDTENGQDNGDWLWWCYMLRQREYRTPGLKMGRACWGGNLQYRQLNTPCVQGDVAVACVPCQGTDTTWDAVYWEGPEGGDS